MVDPGNGFGTRTKCGTVPGVPVCLRSYRMGHPHSSWPKLTGSWANADPTSDDHDAEQVVADEQAFKSASEENGMDLVMLSASFHGVCLT